MIIITADYEQFKNHIIHKGYFHNFRLSKGLSKALSPLVNAYATGVFGGIGKV